MRIMRLFKLVTVQLPAARIVFADRILPRPVLSGGAPARHRRRSPAPPPPIPPTAFAVEAPHGDSEMGAALRLCPRGAFSHVVAYTRPSRHSGCAARRTRCSTTPPTAPAGGRPCRRVRVGPSESAPCPAAPSSNLVDGS